MRYLVYAGVAVFFCLGLLGDELIGDWFFGLIGQ